MDIKQKLELHSIAIPECGCQIWMRSTTPFGYGTVVVNGKTRLAHRVAYELAHGTLSVSACVLHRCDTPSCVNPEHLFLGSRKDNFHDMVRKGRKPLICGEKHPFTKLNNAQVLAIRADKRVQRVIANEYGISQQTVSDIKVRKVWVHL